MSTRMFTWPQTASRPDEYTVTDAYTYLPGRLLVIRRKTRSLVGRLATACETALATARKYAILRTLTLAAVVTALGVGAPPFAQERPRWDELANLPFPNGYPTEEARARLMDEFYFQRAVQVYLGALPAVNMLAMRDASQAKWGAGYNVFPVWKKRMDAKTLVTTPNADVIYAMTYLDLKKDGPLVVAAPPGLLGMFTDFWQRALTDVGFAGPDKGQGGLYLLLPPDYDGPVPNGYYAFRSPTYNVFMFWRALLTRGESGPETAQGVATIEQTMVYPLRVNKPEAWKKMEFPDASGVPVNMLYPTDARFFDMLAKFNDDEPSEATDAYLRGMMASIGIIKGQPFKPDQKQRQILDRAAQVAHNMTGALNATPDAVPERLYYTKAKRRYINAYAGVDDRYNANSYLNIDVRSMFFAIAYSSSPAMAANMIGLGARYPGTNWDADGAPLTGERTYRLHLPPNPPARLFWAVTLYNPQFGTMVDNGQPFPSINALDNRVSQNADGSYDLYFGPELPQGVPESNWIKTNPGQGFLVAIRLYGPTHAFYDQSWIPDDIVKMK